MLGYCLFGLLLREFVDVVVDSGQSAGDGRKEQRDENSADGLERKVLWRRGARRLSLLVFAEFRFSLEKCVCQRMP